MKIFGNTTSVGTGCYGSNHVWTWSGDHQSMNLEGLPCNCKMMIYHTVKCLDCGSDVRQDKLNVKQQENQTQ